MERVRITGRRSFFVLLGLVLHLTGCNGGNDGPGSGSGSGTPVTIAGTVQYEDRTYDSSGFTGTALIPVRKAVVEVVRDADGSVLASGATGTDGSYSLAFTNTGQAGVYLRVKAQTSDDTVVVKSPIGQLWSISSLILDDTAASGFQLNLTATVAAGGGVFNILDVFLTGAEFVTTLTGAPPSLVTARWSAGSCDGTYFDPSDDSIHILGGCTDGDTDQYDDPVLLHEYGHFVAAHYSKDDSPGGIHYLDDNTQDIRLSWSEGWGSFFSSAVRNDPLYMDTSGSVAQLSFEIESLTPPSLASAAIYTTNELSVAAVLWDIFDDTPRETLATAGGTDGVSAGMAPIWDVFANYLKSLACVNCVSFEDFWDGWFNCTVCATGNHDSAAEMATLVADRKMALKEDGFEPDDTVAKAMSIAVGGPAQAHTLYPAGDMDYASFSATANVQYTIATSGLTNGADTFIEILDGNGNIPGASNDDAVTVTKSSTCGVDSLGNSTCPPNGATTLSSKVVFTPTAGGTYYIRVRRSSAAPPSAGVYGSYDLKVTSQ